MAYGFQVNRYASQEIFMRARVPVIRGFLVALLLGLGVFGGGIAQGETSPTVTSLGMGSPASALYVGNSFFYYNNGMSGHVSKLRSAEGPAAPRFRSTAVTIGGSGIDWHDVESYFRPNAIGRYSFDAKNNIVFNEPGKLFDVTIVMDCSQCPIHPQLKSVFREYAKKDSDIIRKHGAIPVFFMSWAYQDRPEMTMQLAEAYTIAGNENRALVIPAGLAFARSLSKRPALVLHDPDKRHPSLAGTYLAACTVYASLFKKSPVGSSYTAGLAADDAAFLQTVAWETVQAYYRW
jgi:hypothetical protein